MIHEPGSRTLTALLARQQAAQRFVTFEGNDDLEIIVEFGGKRYAVTRSGAVMTVFNRRNKKGEVQIIRQKVLRFSRLAKEVRKVAGVKSRLEPDEWY